VERPQHITNDHTLVNSKRKSLSCRLCSTFVRLFIYFRVYICRPNGAATRFCISNCIIKSSRFLSLSSSSSTRDEQKQLSSFPSQRPRCCCLFFHSPSPMHHGHWGSCYAHVYLNKYFFSFFFYYLEKRNKFKEEKKKTRAKRLKLRKQYLRLRRETVLFCRAVRVRACVHITICSCCFVLRSSSLPQSIHHASSISIQSALVYPSDKWPRLVSKTKFHSSPKQQNK